MSQRGISRHIETHLKQEDGEQRAAREYFHIKINGAHEKYYWLNILAHSRASLLELDQFLRTIWLECCGHLSSFRINDELYQHQFEDDMDSWHPTNDIDIPLTDILAEGMKITYEYDFGSTTSLELKVISKRRLTARTESIHLISRNKTPDIECSICSKQNTTHIDIYDGEVLCKSCASKKNKKSKYEGMFLPLVNSPRAGVCAYMGESDPESNYKAEDFEY